MRRMLFDRLSEGPDPRNEPPVERPAPTGRVDGLRCAEPGCSGVLQLRWSHRLERWFYGCSRFPACKGTLSAERDGSPRGSPRTKELQGARNRAHTAFDVLWKDGHCKRRQAYRWLQHTMKLRPIDAHMEQMTVEQCEAVIREVQAKGPGTQAWIDWISAGRPGYGGIGHDNEPAQKRHRRQSSA